MTGSEYEHLQDEVRELIIGPAMETFGNKYHDRDYSIHLEFPEFTCVCPRTALPDFATIIIDYIPGDLIVESKSVKLYLNAYRNIGIFNEHVVNKILDDFVTICKPKFVEVTGIFNPRGGVGITVNASIGDENLRAGLL